MKALKPLGAIACVLLSSSAWAQDAVKSNPTHYKVVFENASVRVLRISYAAGAKSTMHSHPDTIVVPLTTAKVQFTGADGKAQESDLAADSALYTPASSHSVTNLTKGPIDGILIEFKTPAPGTATLPASRPGLAMKMLAEGPRAVAY